MDLPKRCDIDQFHPLELIPFFRRFRPSLGRDILYTAIWSCLLGTLFCLVAMGMSGRLPSAHLYGMYLVISTVIGYAIHGFLALGDLTGIEPWAKSKGFFVKTAYFTVAPLAGVILGFWICSLFLDLGFNGWYGNIGWLASIAGTSVVISAILATIFFWREREALAQAQYERERLRSERIQREATLANLRALQAQIEPHFLFNTLANASSLVESDPATAKRMLDSFNRFLRASLAATRGDSTTLGDEAELIAAYLDVLQVRMGARLRYDIEVPAELRGWQLAPMLLQPVVENAIRHGLEPKIAGGSVTFSARRDADDVVIEVRDSGVGFAPTTRGGLGLSNLRERLEGLHGPRGTLAIVEQPGGGTLVTVRLPA